MAGETGDRSAAQLDQICLDNLLAATDDHAYFKDLQSRFLRVSAGVVRAAGQPRAELRGLRVDTEADLLGKSDFDLFTDEQARDAFDAEQDIISSEQPMVGVIERQSWPDRPPTYVLTNKMPLRDADGTVVGTFGFSRDVTDDLLVRRQLASVLANSPDGISRLDPQLRYAFINPAAQAMLGLHEEHILGRTHADLGGDAEVADRWLTTLEQVVQTGAAAQLEHESGVPPEVRYYDSRIVPETDGDHVTGILVLTRDITSRKRAELLLAEQAVHDPLTGLANRKLLVDRFEQSLLRLERLPGTVAVLFIDLDRFKAINDSLGHAYGDALLIEVATRLDSCARRSDTVARFGGDEFVMLCDRVSAPDDARTIVERVSAALSRPFSHQGQEVDISASIGITTTADARGVPADLLRDADVAMYQAKQRGDRTSSYQIFVPAEH